LASASSPPRIFCSNPEADRRPRARRAASASQSSTGATPAPAKNAIPPANVADVNAIMPMTYNHAMTTMCTGTAIAICTKQERHDTIVGLHYPERPEQGRHAARHRDRP